jgi:hypothetical protein
MTTHTTKQAQQVPALYRKSLSNALRNGGELDWTFLDDAACAEAPVTDFFADGPGQIAPGLKLCTECPVVAACLATGMAREVLANQAGVVTEHHPLFGVFGATLPKLRAAIHARIPEEWPALIDAAWSQAFEYTSGFRRKDGVKRFSKDAARPACPEHSGSNVIKRSRRRNARDGERARWQCRSDEGSHMFSTRPDVNGEHLPIPPGNVRKRKK